MKRLLMLVAALLLVSVPFGCGGGSKRAAMPAGVAGDISVLSLGAETSNLNADQVALLQRSLDWMDRDILKSLQRAGMNAVRIGAEQEFAGTGNSHLLKIAITDHKMIPRGARVFGGMMAGADRLNVHYHLVDRSGATVLAWDDVQASTKGGTYAAQTLNRNAVAKVAGYLSGK